MVHLQQFRLIKSSKFKNSEDTPRRNGQGLSSDTEQKFRQLVEDCRKKKKNHNLKLLAIISLEFKESKPNIKRGNVRDM